MSFEERPVGHGVIYVIEWRVIEEFPKYEINQDGEIRNARTEKLKSTHDSPRNHRFRFMEQGERIDIPVRNLRNRTFPELDPW